MRRNCMQMLGLALVLCSPMSGMVFQEGASESQADATERIDLRITATGVERQINVDRGTRDGVEVGDRIALRPRDGRTAWARVIAVTERGATAEVRTPGALPPVGTRGYVHVPLSRFEAPKPQARGSVVAPPKAEEPEGEIANEENPWSFVEEGWNEDMPLLAGLPKVRPETRPMDYAGRVYLIGDWIQGSEGGRGDHFLRLGASATFDNPFDYGGVLNYEGEHSLRSTRVPEDTGEGEDFSNFRLDRLSYTWGGTRFESHRYEFGRFLNNGMPEFGVLDGFEWSERRDTGAQIGASVGFLPEPIADGNSREDVGLSVWYGWVDDETETTAVRGGYQKTFNDGDPDRDLFVLKGHHLPIEGWNLYGTLWIDRYTGDDEAKGSGFELTRAILTAGHRWKNGDGVDLSYTQDRFPEILRTEFIPVVADVLADYYDERLGVSGWKQLEGGKRLRTRAGIWRDQDAEGFDLDVGLDVPEVALDRDVARFTVFANDAKFANTLGLRLGYGRTVGSGRWDGFYEWSTIHQTGFDDASDDSIQHRFHGSRTFVTTGPVSVSLYGTLILQDIDNIYTAGLYLQWSF